MASGSEHTINLVAFRFLVRAFSSEDAGGRVLLIMSLVHLVVMTTKIHSGKTVKTSQVKSSMRSYLMAFS